MPAYLVSLIIIIFFSIIVFKLTEKCFGSYFQEGEISNWLKTWIVLVTIPFFAGNYWFFIIASAVVLIYAFRKADDRLPLFMLLLAAIPPYMQRVPGLFEITFLKLLTIILVTPLLLSKKWRPNTPGLGKPLADKLLIALIVLFTILAMRGTTPGDSLRYGIGLSLGWFLPYFAASRMISNFNHLKKVLIALMMGFSTVGLVGAFENIKGWLVYEIMAGRLQVISFQLGGGLMRGDELRALASFNHPLTLGIAMMITFGVFLFLGSLIKTKKWRWIYFLIVSAGLYSPVSRGPWVGAFIIFLIFISTGKKVVQNLTLLTISFLIIIPILPGLPGGQKIINLLPFFGTAEQFNVDYRKELVPRAMDILARSPAFGVFDATKEPEMSDMVQGEGIVDLVNAYLNIGLFGGLVGLSLWIWFFLSISFKLFNSRRYIKDKTSEEYRCARMLLAVTLGTSVTISTTGFNGVVTTFIYIIAGIMYSYSRIIRNAAREEQAIKFDRN